MTAPRSAELGIQLLQKQDGNVFIVVEINNMPWQSLGPYKEKLDICQALGLVATELRFAEHSYRMFDYGVQQR